MTELWSEATTQDLLQMSLIIFGVGFVAVWILSRILEYFVGLKSPPTKRAALTVGSAYLIAAIVFVAFVPISYAPLAVLAPLPGSIGWFLYVRSHFRRGWYDDTDELPDGVELASDSWIDGLLYLALAIVIAAGVLLFRLIRNGILGSI